MGFFGSSKKTYYSSTSAKLFDKSPSLVKQSVVASIAQNRNIAQDLIVNLTNGIGYKANNLYNFGRSGQYPYGLPNGTTGSLPGNTYAYVKLVIESWLGASIEIQFCTLDRSPITNHFIYECSYYRLNNAGLVVGEPRDWYYDESTKRYPILNIEDVQAVGLSPYYPIIPLRINSQDTTGAGKTHHDAITRAGSFIGVDVEQVTASINAQGSSPIEDAFVVLGVELRETDQIPIEYLYEFFKQLAADSQHGKDGYDAWLESRTSKSSPPINSIKLADANYSIEIGWLWADSEIRNGVIGNLGIISRSSTEDKGDWEYKSGNTVSTDLIHFHKQINKYQYSTITIAGLVHTNIVVGREIRTTVFDALNTNDAAAASFSIPLRKDILTAMGGIKTHDVMYASIRLIVNDKLTIKLKWYQTAFFSFVILVIAIVISIWFPPAGVVAFTATAVGIAIIQVIAFKMLMPLIMQELGDIIGEEAALIVAVVASLYMGDFSGVAIASSANTLVSGLATINYENSLEKIQDEMDAISGELEDLLEEKAETDFNVLTTVNNLTDINALSATDYVRRFYYTNLAPLLIGETTHRYVDISNYVSSPSSQIRLGNSIQV